MSAAAAPVVAEPTSTVDEDVESIQRDGDADFTGWFCISTNPYPCPKEGCLFVARFQTACHLIVVWPRIDDPEMLGVAANCRELKRQPRILEYQPDFGAAISWDYWVRLGRPVHGVGQPPPGYKSGGRL